MLFSSLLFLLAAEPSIHLERLPITVNRPVDARFAPHTDKYLYICEHFGKVRVVVNGLLRFEPFLDIDYLTTDQVEQAGLLSIAFSPDFKRDKTFWVCYIDNNLDQVIARYTAKKFTKAKRKGDIIFTSSVLVKNQHYGGTMHFGADGMLYMATGDGGDKTKPQDLRQTDWPSRSTASEESSVHREEDAHTERARRLLHAGL